MVAYCRQVQLPLRGGDGAAAVRGAGSAVQARVRATAGVRAPCVRARVPQRGVRGVPPRRSTHVPLRQGGAASAPFHTPAQPSTRNTSTYRHQYPFMGFLTHGLGNCRSGLRGQVVQSCMSAQIHIPGRAAASDCVWCAGDACGAALRPGAAHLRGHLRQAPGVRGAPLRGALPHGRVPRRVPRRGREELRMRQDAEDRALLRTAAVRVLPTCFLPVPTLLHCFGTHVPTESKHSACNPCRCDRRCTAIRSCGRHPCKRRCCDGSCPPCDQVRRKPSMNLGVAEVRKICFCMYMTG